MTLQIKQLDDMQIIFKLVDDNHSLEIGYVGSAGDIGLLRCPTCFGSNHPLAVRTGICDKCGYDLNVELK